MAIAVNSAVVHPAQSTGTEVTIYNDGFGLVKECRTLELQEGRQTVAIEDVASSIEPASVGMRSITSPSGVRVVEQNYAFDLISPQAILAKSVGRRVRLVRAIGNSREIIEGTLLSPPADALDAASTSGMVVRADDGRILLSPSGEVEVTEVPEGLISVPTLIWDIRSDNAGPNEVELSYLTKDVSWTADYVLTIDGEGGGQLQAWVTITNQSGATYRDAKLKLLAGDVNRVRPAYNADINYAVACAARPRASDEEFRFVEEPLSEYHLYTLQRPATIRQNEIKQLALIEPANLEVDKKLFVDSMRNSGTYYPSEGVRGVGAIKPLTRVEFLNTRENGLGVPLPKGKLKVYQRDRSGSVQMLGEDMIGHTPQGERISVLVGSSFDILATRTRTAYRRASGRSSEETFEIELRNRKGTAETITVLERHYGDWRVTSASHTHSKDNASTLAFVVEVQPDEVKKIVYSVNTKW